MPKIHLNLFDRASVQAALKQVEAYRDGLPEKIEKLQKRIAEEIRQSADAGFGGAAKEDIIFGEVADEDVVVTVEDGGENVSIVRASGPSAIWQEFGAGVYYNGPVGNSPNPLGKQNLFFIGKFGQGKGARNVWGFYYPKGSKNLVLTHGTPASMPMYHAEQEVIEKIVEIAREVFQEGDGS